MRDGKHIGKIIISSPSRNAVKVPVSVAHFIILACVCVSVY